MLSKSSGRLATTRKKFGIPKAIIYDKNRPQKLQKEHMTFALPTSTQPNLNNVKYKKDTENIREFASQSLFI
jgi:hypothetical protein